MEQAVFGRVVATVAVPDDQHHERDRDDEPDPVAGAAPVRQLRCRPERVLAPCGDVGRALADGASVAAVIRRVASQTCAVASGNAPGQRGSTTVGERVAVERGRVLAAHRAQLGDGHVAPRLSMTSCVSGQVLSPCG